MRSSLQCSSQRHSPLVWSGMTLPSRSSNTSPTPAGLRLTFTASDKVSSYHLRPPSSLALPQSSSSKGCSPFVVFSFASLGPHNLVDVEFSQSCLSYQHNRSTSDPVTMPTAWSSLMCLGSGCDRFLELSPFIFRGGHEALDSQNSSEGPAEDFLAP